MEVLGSSLGAFFSFCSTFFSSNVLMFCFLGFINFNDSLCVLMFF